MLLSVLQSTFDIYPATKQFIKISVTSFSWYEVLLLGVLFLLKASKDLVVKREHHSGYMPAAVSVPGTLSCFWDQWPRLGIDVHRAADGSMLTCGQEPLPSPGLFISNLRWPLVIPHQRLSHLLSIFSYTHKYKYSCTLIYPRFFQVKWNHIIHCLQQSHYLLKFRQLSMMAMEIATVLSKALYASMCL